MLASTQRRLPLKIAVLLMASVLSIAQNFPPSAPPDVTTYRAMRWIGLEHVHYEYISVNAGDWVEVRVSCGIAHCAQPAYFYGGEQKMPKLWNWSVGGFGSDVFGQVAPQSGRVKVLIPVLYRNIEYRGSITVSGGPRP